MFAACLLSFFISFLLFGQVSLWFRLLAFSHHSVLGFIFVLAMCYIGIRQGLRIGKQFCRGSLNLWEVSGMVLLVASLFDLISPWFYATFVHSALQMAVGGVLLILTVTLKVMLFPVARHLDLSPALSIEGFSFRRVDLAAVVGMVTAPLLVAVIFLALFSVQNSFVIFAIVAFLGCVACWKGDLQPTTRVMINLFAMVIFSFIFLQESMLFMSPTSVLPVSVAALAEVDNLALNLKEMPAVGAGLQDNVLILGDNGSDFQTDLPSLLNPNPSALRSQLPSSPQNVLMIGVSLRAWLKLLTSFPEIQNIDVVEMNMNHLATIRSAHKRKGVLFDSRLHLSVDDSRRWLKNHPKQRYDLIVVNSTCYWRSCASRLLSREFLALVQLHTKEGGAVMYNASGSRYVASLPSVF